MCVSKKLELAVFRSVAIVFAVAEASGRLETTPLSEIPALALMATSYNYARPKLCSSAL